MTRRRRAAVAACLLALAAADGALAQQTPRGAKAPADPQPAKSYTRPPPWTGTGTFTETNTPLVSTPTPDYLASADRGYGMVPAAGTKPNNGWMCFEWLNSDGYTFPIRVVNGTPSQPSGGIPACLASVDGKGCHLVSPSFGPDGIPPETAQVGDWSRCQALVDAAKKDDPYLACGDDFKKVYGWDGFDETDRESWCAAASLALDIRPDELRHHVDSAVLNTNFEKAAGRPPNYPTKEMRPAPRPENELFAECTQWGWGCASCDELRYQCNDGIAISCEWIAKIPPSCPGDGVRDTSLEWYLERMQDVFPLSRYTQTSGRPKPTAAPEPPSGAEAVKVQKLFRRDLAGKVSQVSSSPRGMAVGVTGAALAAAGIAAAML